MTDFCQPACLPECPRVFERIRVLPQIIGNTLVEWTFDPHFCDPPPYSFQLQTSPAGIAGADDWEDVGLPAEDVCHLVDDTQRVYGKTQWTHYRIVLTTSKGVYTSAPVNALGVLDHRLWRIVREIVRKEMLVFRQHSGQEGYLLKRRIQGEACPECTDFMTEEVRDADCEICLGTGFVGGYYAPVPCVYAALSQKNWREELDAGQSRGTVSDVVSGARMLAFPMLHERDVWVAKNNDLRWMIHRIQNAVEVRGVPVVCDPVEMRLLPFSDIAYRIPVS